MSKNIKTITKILITILIALAVLLILPKNENAYSYKTIAGKNINNDNSYAKLLQALDEKANSYSNFPSIKNNKLEGLDNFAIGSLIKSNDGQSEYCHVWNRYGLIYEYKTTAFCYHATTSSPIHESVREIRAILIIDDEGIDHINYNNEYNKSISSMNNNGNNIYLQKMLANLYISQSNLDVARDCANFYMYSNARNIWIGKVADELWGSNSEENIRKIAQLAIPDSYSGFGNANNFSNDYAWNLENEAYKDYKYKGIFIFADTAGGQGSFYYRVVREEKTQPVKLTFKKTDFSGKALSGAGIIVKGTAYNNNIDSIDGRKSGGYLEYNRNGIYNTITVYPRNNTGTFYLALKETEAPSGYAGLSETVVLTVKYDKATGDVNSITEDSSYIVSSGSTVTIKNKPKVNLIINKTDSLTGAKLANARFKIELTNVESMEDYQIPQVKGEEKQNSPTVVYVKTDNNGQIKLTGIVPKNGKGTITATITEVEVPTANGYYYKEIEPITVKMTYNNGTWTEDGVGSISGNTLTVAIQNDPYINLSGMVWEDGQIGNKIVSGPNGTRDEYYKYEKVEDGQGNYTATYNSDGTVDFKEVEQGKGNYIKVETIKEKGLEGVVVGLKRTSDGTIIKTRITDSNGAYTFTDVPYLGNTDGYQVIFAYDGINYKATDKDAGTDDTKDSDVTDDGRTEFNNKFKSISKGIATSTDGETIPLGYDYNEEEGKSTLKVEMDGTNPANVDKNGKTQTDFQIRAVTEKYTTTTENVDCGLVKKELDLAVGTDVKEAKLKINDKETTYSYAQIMDGGLEDLSLDDILQNKSSTSKEDIKYNLYLYTSDYNYRIKDYQTGINNNVNDDKYDYEADSTLKKLEAYVTYSVILKNQSTYNATVDEFVYYYDEAYIPQFKVNDVIDGYKVISIENNKITFENAGENNVLSKDNSYRKEVSLTFKVNENEAGNITTKTATNVAEITKYSTDIGGLIDKDSAPGNANVKFENGTPKVGQYEDDTDEAKGINISLRTESRTITGTVFEDTDKDGKLNNKNRAVNDVIVQLIEIKQINGNYFEYIWQETRSGSNTVKTTARNGYEGTTYTNSVQARSGQYEFKDFIPGNYIIRFIYGDGRTLDVNSEAYKNTTQYNGQDYKSTIDANYNSEWYDATKYAEEQSVARDNEARRLEVMAYSTTIDKTKGAHLADKNEEALNNTWMAAETSRINVPVDEENTVSFTNVHFGLVLRPQTKLVLEKHITGLKITPAGTGVQSIIDAKANIENIVNGKTVEISGVTDGLAVVYANRGNRGFWQVATDIEELAQGASLEVEYTYVLRNDGEKDYLSSTLVQEYENNVSNYSNYLLNIVKPGEGNLKNNLKGNTHKYGTYLGEYYYTGDVGTSDAEVLSRIETLEEAINNELIFDEGTDFKKINEEAISKNVYDRDGNLVNNVENGTKNINTVVQSTSSSKFLTPKAENAYTEKTADWSKTITLRTTLASVSGGELGANLPSYIAEITTYSNAAGRRDMSSEPANLSYVHSDDNEMTLANSGNEEDEFWAETIIITKPTGEDKLTPMQIVIIAISGVAVIAVGIVLIKKFVLKK